jgi:DNA primase
VPILQLFERYGHSIRRAGGQWVTRCPFHDDQRPSLTLSPARGLWYCHPCGVGGDGIAYVMQRKGIDFADAVREVAA